MLRVKSSRSGRDLGRVSNNSQPPADSSLRSNDKRHVSAIDFRLAQLLHGGFGANGRIVDLFEGVGLCLGADDGEYFDVPVVVVVDGLPITEILGRMKTAGRSVKYEVKFFGYGTNALQRSAQEGGEVSAQAGLV